MSFLDSVLSSIETGKPAPIPTASPAPSPISSLTAKAEVRRPDIPSRSVSSERKNGVTVGTKRKAEEPLLRPQKLASQASAKPNTMKATPLPAASKPRSTMNPAVTKPSSAPTTVPSKKPQAPSKAPVKGSFQDLMLKAKAVQEKAPTQVGMFKHQAASKEKLSKVERKKRAVEAQMKEKESKSAKRVASSSGPNTNTKPGSVRDIRRREPETSSYKGTGRPTTTAPAQPEYRGTAGLASRHGSNDRNSHRKPNTRPRNEYLGTDEEDEGNFTDDYDDYYSGSSDMEAGLDDMEEEEAAALALARREDEEELRAEIAAKKEKLERRKKLSMLASRKH